MTHTVQKQILSYMLQGGTLTVRKAQRMFHTTELRHVVSKLRKKGYTISDKWLHAVTQDGRPTQFKQYYIADENAFEILPAYLTDREKRRSERNRRRFMRRRAALRWVMKTFRLYRSL